MTMGQTERSRQPTHLCLDCGAVGYAGGYHDHGGGSAGDTARIVDVLTQLKAGGDALDRLARLRERMCMWCGAVPSEHPTGTWWDEVYEENGLRRIASFCTKEHADEWRESKARPAENWS